MSLLELLKQPYATKVSISSTGAVSVDFADVMKTEQFQSDLDALKELAASASSR